MLNQTIMTRDGDPAKYYITRFCTVTQNHNINTTIWQDYYGNTFQILKLQLMGKKLGGPSTHHTASNT